MKRLLNIEFIKLWNSRSSKILVFAYFFLLSLISLISIISFPLGKVYFRLADQGIFNFPYIWHLNTWVASIIKIFFAVVIVSMISNEYSNKTLKQNLIDGLSKKEFLLSKFYMILVFTILSTAFVTVVTLILGFIFSDFKTVSIILTDTDYLFAYFVKLIAFFSFCFFLGMLIRKSAFALGFLVLWQMFESISYGILRHNLPPNSKIADNLANYFYPLNAMSNLIKEPITRLNTVHTVAGQIGEVITKNYRTHWYEYAIVLVWTFIFLYASYTLLKKRDL